MPVPEALTPLGAFGWGSLGGIGMALAVFVLPIVSHVAITGWIEPRHRGHAVGTVLLVVLLGALAGIVTLTLPDTVTRSQAILPGFASPAIVKGVVRAGMEATPAWWLQQAPPRGL